MAGSASSAVFPIITGVVLDHFRALGSIKTGYGYLFAFCSVGYVIGFALHHFLAPSFKAITFQKKDLSIA
jgi:ACS family hexuronate transporter-like MFS transporter